MLQGIARLGDQCQGVCFAHSGARAWTGYFATASGGFTVDGLGAVVVGDTGNTDCGHHFQAIAGSSVLTGNGIPVVRVGDAVTVLEGGNGTVTTGSSVGKSE